DLGRKKVMVISLGAMVALAAVILFTIRGRARVAAITLCVVAASAVGGALFERRESDQAMNETVGSMCRSLAHWLVTTAEIYAQNQYEPAKHQLDGLRFLIPAAGRLCVPDPDDCNVMLDQGGLGSVPSPALVKPVADALRARR